MGYRIQYGESFTKEIIKEKGHNRYRSRILIVAAIATAIAIILFSGIGEYLIPGDPEVTKSAASHFSHNVKHGADIAEAFSTFCKEIIAGAELS